MPPPTATQNLTGRVPELPTWFLPVVLFLVTVGVHVSLARHMVTPIIHADEFGYLMGAHFMARGGTPTGEPYYPGYSAMLVPLWWLSGSANTVYRWALEVNAGLAGVTSVLLYHLARRTAPRAGPVTWAAATVVVAAYPALVLFSDIVESENLLVPGLLATCLLLMRALEVPTARRWAAAGAAGGLLYAVHGRALAVAAALVLTALWILRPWRSWISPLVAGGAALGAALALSALWTRWVTRAVVGQQLPPVGPRAPHILSRLETFSGWRHVGVVLAGQILYLMAAAAALLALGVVALWSRGRGPTAARVERGQAAFLLLALGGAAVIAAVFLASGNRIDDAVYGRYIEVFAAPVLVVGALRAVEWRRAPPPLRQAWRLPAAAGVVIVLSGLVVLAYWSVSVRGAVVKSNALAVSELVGGPDTAAHLSTLVVVGVALAGLLAVLAAYRASAVVGVLVAAGAFVPATARAYGDVVNQSAAALLQRGVPSTLVAMERRFGPIRCAAWDSATADAWGFYNTRLFAPDIAFPVFNSARAGALGCGSGVVVSTHSFGHSFGATVATAAYRGARPVLLDNGGDAVWALPGLLQDRLGTAGWLLPAGFPAALPTAAATGSISASAQNVTVGQRGTTPLTVRVAHSGGGSPWPNAAAIGPVPRYAVRLALTWYPAGSRDPSQAVATGRADLPNSLLPGQAEDVPVGLAPLAFGSTTLTPTYLPPGPYDVKVSLIQESVSAWDATIPPLWLHVLVKRG